VDKSREEFEAWFKNEWLDKVAPMTMIERHRLHNIAWSAWQASRKAGKAVAYMTHHGSAVSPDDFKGGEEEMLFFAKVDGWTPLISGITVKGDE